jgi:hypothetical protein
MRAVIAAFVVALLAIQVNAIQDPDPVEVYPGQRVAWDPADATAMKETNYYEFRHSPTAIWRKVGLTREWPIPALPEGEYGLELRACRERKEKDTMAIVKLCSVPSYLRIRMLAAGAPKSPRNFLVKCHP